MRYEEVVEKFKANKALAIISEKDIPSGKQITVSNGTILTCYNKGTIQYQGKNIEETRAFLGETTSCKNNKIFIVYGHDKDAKNQLELLLRRWGLDPILLDQQASKGNTIIEKLEECTNDVGYAIVLATPDDKGHRKGAEDEKKSRVRQNVVLELGMLITKIGREKIAILLQDDGDFERPSDIHGLMYIPFKESIEEVKTDLIKELATQGYSIDPKCL